MRPKNGKIKTENIPSFLNFLPKWKIFQKRQKFDFEDFRGLRNPPILESSGSIILEHIEIDFHVHLDSRIRFPLCSQNGQN